MDEENLMDTIDFDIMPDETQELPTVPQNAPPLVDFDSDMENGEEMIMNTNRCKYTYTA